MPCSSSSLRRWRGGDHARPSNSLMALTTGARCLLAEIVAAEGSGLIRLTSNVSLFNCQRAVTAVRPSKSFVRRWAARLRS
jgi:hypothetical protein